MSFRSNKPEKVARISTIATLSFMVCWGLASVLREIRPFWVDEWRVIYNLKFKSSAALWGQLDFLQQFPRVYLAIIKAFTSAYDYSYLSLRLPSFIVGSLTIVLCYRLMNRLYARNNINRFLFVMILISCSTFTEYFVQIKQYTMDILLSVVVVWQLTELISIKDNHRLQPVKYGLLCLSFLVFPFFSYTYPIAVAPVFAIVLFQDVLMLKKDDPTRRKRKILLTQWLPLFLATFSITVFYFMDVAQLMQDNSMHEFWGHLMMNKGFSWRSFFINFYMLFAEIGAGLIYWLLFGILGIISFIYGIYTCTVNLKALKTNREALLLLYSTLLLMLVIVLFAAGKLPLGEPRLNAFTIPSVSILMIYLLDQLNRPGIKGKISISLSVLLLVGLTGNIYTTFFAAVTGEEYAKKINIYQSTGNAIRLAASRHLPILVTPGVAYPYDKTRNLPFNNTVPGDWVLKTHPAYKVMDYIPVYAIDSLANVNEYMAQLPEGVTVTVVGDGSSYKIVNK